MISKFERWFEFALWPLDPEDPMIECWVSTMKWMDYV